MLNLAFSLYFLEQKIGIPEFKVLDAKIYFFNFLMQKNWNSNCPRLSVNHVQSRADISALVP
jgi:hypothetical protein